MIPTQICNNLVQHNVGETYIWMSRGVKCRKKTIGRVSVQNCSCFWHVLRPVISHTGNFYLAVHVLSCQIEQNYLLFYFSYSLPVAPQETDIKVTPFGSDQLLCSLSLRKFYPQNINIKWSDEELNIPILPSTKKIIQTDDEKIFDALSECIIPWKSLKSSVRVMWAHDSLKEPGYRDLCITGTTTYTAMTMQDIHNKTESFILEQFYSVFKKNNVVFSF